MLLTSQGYVGILLRLTIWMPCALFLASCTFLVGSVEEVADDSINILDQIPVILLLECSNVETEAVTDNLRNYESVILNYKRTTWKSWIDWNDNNPTCEEVYGFLYFLMDRHWHLYSPGITLTTSNYEKKIKTHNLLLSMIITSYKKILVVKLQSRK